DRGRVLERVADIAVRVIGGDIVVVGIGEVGVPLVAEIRPGDVLFVEGIADGAHGRWRDREHGFGWVADVEIGVSAVAVVSGIAVGGDGLRERTQKADNLRNAGLAQVGTVGIGSAAVGS